MKIKKLILILMFTLLLLVVVYFLTGSFTGFVVSQDSDRKFDSFWTTAICEGVECADYEVTCKDGNLVGIKRVSDFVYLGDNWEDPRSEEQRELCR